MAKRAKQIAILGLSGVVALSSLSGCADKPFYADEDQNQSDNTSTSSEGIDGNIDTDIEDPWGNGGEGDGETQSPEPEGTPEPTTPPETEEPGGTPEPTTPPETVEPSESTAPGGTTPPETVEPSESPAPGGTTPPETTEPSESPKPTTPPEETPAPVENATCDYEKADGSDSTTIYNDTSLFFKLNHVKSIVSVSGADYEEVKNGDGSVTLVVDSASLTNFSQSTVSITAEGLNDEITVFSYDFFRFVGMPSLKVNVTATAEVEIDGIHYYTGDLSAEVEVPEELQNYVEWSTSEADGVLSVHVSFVNGETSYVDLFNYVKKESLPTFDVVSSTIETVELEGKTCITKDGIITIVAKDDILGIDSGEILLQQDNPAITTTDNSTWVIDTSKLPAHTDIRELFRVSDALGNSATYSLNMQRVVGLEEVGYSHELLGEVAENSGVYWFRESPMVEHSSIVPNTNYEGTLLEDIILLKDGAEVGSFPETLTIEEDGSYAFKVKYKTGAESRVFQIGSFARDVSAPEVSEDTSNVSIHEGYVVADGVITYSVTDSGAGVKDIVVSGLSEDAYTINKDTNMVTVNTSMLPNKGTTDYSISSEDNLGNKNEVQYSVNRLVGMDDSEYAYKLLVGSGSMYQDNGIVYYNGELSYSFAESLNEDLEKGIISRVEVVKDSEHVAELTADNGYSYSFSEVSGEYSLRVFYKNGDQSSSPMGNIVYDDTCEGVTSVSFSGDTYTGGETVLVTGDGVVSFSAEDLLSGVNRVEVGGLEEGMYEINGSEVLVYTDRLENLARTSFSVTVTDNLGNNSVYNYSVNRLVGVQNLSTNVKFTGKYYEDTAKYYNSDLTLKQADLGMNDFELAAVSSVEVVDRDGNVVGSLLDEDIVVSGTTNEYTLRVTYVTGEIRVEDLGSIVYDNAVDSLSENVVSATALEGTDGERYFIGDGLIQYAYSDSLSGVNRVDVKGLPGGSYTSDGGAVSVNTAKLGTDDIYSVDVTVYDNVGNSLTKSFEIRMLRSGDSTADTVNSVKTQDWAYVKGGTSYVQSEFNFELNAYSNRVSRVELLKDGEFYADVTGRKCKISDNGIYSLRVTTILGTEDVALTLLDDVSTNFVIDGVLDTLEFKGYNNCSEVTGSDGILYVTRNGQVEFNVGDALSGIQSTSVKTGNSAVEYSISNGVISVDTSQFADGRVVLKLSAVDNVGNVSNIEQTVDILREVPAITGVNHTSTANIDGTSYAKSNLVVSVSGYNHEKMRFVQMYKDGEFYKDFVDGQCEIADNGVYSIRTEDVAGNVKTYVLTDLFNNIHNSIVVDLKTPVISATVNDQPIADVWLTEDSRLGFKVTDNEALQSVVVTINDVNYPYQLDDGRAEFVEYIDLKNSVVCAENGEYRVVITATDRAGNVLTTDEDIVYYDYTAPEVRVNVSGNYTQDDDGYLYVQGSLAVSDAGCSDIGSGIAAIEVLNNGVVVEDGLVCSSDGEYTVRVTDIAGLATEVKLHEFIEGVTTSKIRIDNESPVCKRVSGFDYELDKDGYLWYSTQPTFVYKITDKYMKNVSIKVNGDEQVSGLSESGEYIINTGNYSGIVKIEVSATDKYGHSVSDSFSYRTDLSAPTITGSVLSGNYLERMGTLFFKSNPSVVVSAEDSESGIKSYTLSGTRSEVKENGAFELGTGEYSVEVVDYLGNTTGIRSIKDLCGLSSNSFIVDGEAPVISTKRPDGSYEGWFANDVTYDINLSDNQGIKSATIAINDTVVTTYTSEDITTQSAKISGSTSGAKANTEGGYRVIVTVEDNAGNTSSWEDYIKIDRTAPVVEFFEFTGDGFIEGDGINGTDRYGFFFTGDSQVRIRVSDGEISSGMNNLYVTLTESNGKETTQTLPIVDGYSTLTLPVNFKGFISAYADDKVNNKGAQAAPDGIVSEDANFFMNNLKLNIVLQGTEYKDRSGYPLYNKSCQVTGEIACGWSGVREIEWGTSVGEGGKITVDANGTVSGSSANVIATDKNLVVDLSSALTVNGNENNIEIWLEVTDRAGRKSRTSQVLSIDLDAPVISLNWNNTEQDGYYKDTRVAHLSVAERNFNPELVTMSGKYGQFSGWRNTGEGSWEASLTFDEDGVYGFSIGLTDMAGNPGNTVSAEEFVIDKTSPSISVSWNNTDSRNSKYYDKGRTATITVTEHNFNPALISLEGSGTLSGWSGSGDVHTATVSFNGDGEYAFTIHGKDMADNEFEQYSSGDFIIDTEAPVVEISGVETGISYKKNVGLAVSVSDSYIDASKSYVTLVGKNHENVELEGSFNLKTGEFVFENFPETVDWDDIYILTVHIEDMAGNFTDGERIFSVNRFGSSYEFINSEMLNSYINAPKQVVIRETNVDQLDMEKVRVVVILNGEEVKVDQSLIKVEEQEGKDGKYHYSYIVEPDAFKEDGKYLVQIYSTAYDGTENSSLSQEYAFILDTTAPEVLISGVKSGGSYHEYSQYVTFDIREAIGVKSLSVLLNGAEVELEESNGVYGLTVMESPHDQNLKVIVEDLAGNKTVETIENFFITSNLWSYLVNQLWFRVTLGSIGAFILFLLALLFGSRRKSRKSEEKLLKDNVELYKSSTMSSTSVGSVGTKDEVEELDK